MGSNEQPEEASDRTLTLRLSRENLTLAAAIAFLLAAAVLAIFFSMEDATTPAPQGPTAIAGVATAGTAATPVLLPTSGAPYPNPVQQTPPATFETQPYPDPNEPGQSPSPEGDPNNQEPSPTADDLFAVDTPSAQTPGAGTAADATPASTSAAGQQVPTFEPARPTATASSGNPYPAPSTAQTQPTDAPAPVAPTAPIFDPTDAPATPNPSPRTPAPTNEPAAGATDAPTPTPTPAATQPPATPAPPTPIPADVVRGTVRWTTAQSPITLRRDLQIAPGSSLLIDPGVEVRITPGAAIYVDGNLYARGQPGQPVKIVSTGGGRWDAIYGRPGADIGLDQVELSGGGNGGTLIFSEGGNLSIVRSQIRDNGGQIRSYDSRVEMRETDVSGNDLPYGAAVEVSFLNGGGVTLIGNRIGGNRQAAGAPPVQIRNEGAFDTVNLDAQGNLLVGRDGPAMVVATNGPLRGTLSCNALLNGTEGLMIKAGLLQVAPEVALNISNNVIADQTPPIIPIYLTYGIGRGASSDIYIDMRNNYWNSALGPYHPELYADGRGEAVGANIDFAPWLAERPACAPRP
ncbi:MAG: hypothetical protein H7Z42_09730 [Roseiflexaceae bacterium]|nr:hypothetical protein [Roseiflexaceae bacterium]